MSYFISQIVAPIWLIFTIPSIAQVAGTKNELIFIINGIDSLGQISPGINTKINDVTTSKSRADSLVLNTKEIAWEKNDAQ